MTNTTRMMVALALTGTCLLAAGLLWPAEEPDQALAEQILEAAGVKGGVVVHLGCGDGKLTAALRANDSYLVHGLDARARNVRRAREHIRSLGLYGPVSVEQWRGDRLPYTDNLVNLLVAERSGKVSRDEMLRVLAPGGVAYVKKGQKWTKSVKPWPPNIDEWTHYCHGPDGNPVANDTVVGPPKRYQWVAGPLWLRAHDTDSSVNALVSAGGRIFYIVDEAPISLPGDHPLPDKWSLVARDAFNGVLLWKVPIEHWGWREWKETWFKCRPGDMPLNLHRRVVASADSVYATLGYRAPVSRLDARTGEVIRTYDGTERTNEIIYCNGVLVLSMNSEEGLKIAALEASTGKMLWQTGDTYRGTKREFLRWSARWGKVKEPELDAVANLATDDGALCLLDGQDVVCLDFGTGEERWRTTVADDEGDLWVGTLIVHEGTVLHATTKKLVGLAAATGEELWSKPKRELGWLWFQWKDVFVTRGLVWTWSAELEQKQYEQGKTKGRAMWPASVNGYDLVTGELKKQVPLGNIFSAHHHHRCYRNKATQRYILASRRGTEFIDLETGEHTVHNWVRGTCHLGMMPANGLHYVPPHPCACYINEKLSGFNALAPGIAPKYRGEEAETSPRLERGPAFGQAAGPQARPGGWPTFRHDSMRTGSTEAAVPSRLQPRWATQVGDKLSAPTVVGDKVFVSLVDEHHVAALNVEDGTQLWSFAAGGRVDSPPTYWREMVMFGSADGCVYCLRAADGELVWRFRAAPAERRIGAFGQLESTWPVHGSVLVRDDVVYFAAGRSSYLDDGIHLYGLEAASGKAIHRAQLAGPSTDFSDPEAHFRYGGGPGALPDILQADSEGVYMRHLAFDRDLMKQPGGAPRVQARGGFLDDTYFRRAFWFFQKPAHWARLIVHNDRAFYGIRMFDTLRCLDPHNFFVPGKQGYLLFAQSLGESKPEWSRRIPIRAKAMVAAERRLFVAGPPDLVDPEDPLGAFEGRKGGLLWVLSGDTGETLAEYTLDSPPVFNGMAAAGGRLYISTRDGQVLCMG